MCNISHIHSESVHPQVQLIAMRLLIANKHQQPGGLKIKYKAKKKTGLVEVLIVRRGSCATFLPPIHCGGYASDLG